MFCKRLFIMCGNYSLLYCLNSHDQIVVWVCGIHYIWKSIQIRLHQTKASELHRSQRHLLKNLYTRLYRITAGVPVDIIHGHPQILVQICNPLSKHRYQSHKAYFKETCHERCYSCPWERCSCFQREQTQGYDHSTCCVWYTKGER